VKVRGWRAGIVSAYPNIIEIKNAQPVTGGGAK
jgi:hypothetical protein